jgi:hypothetical protein
MAVLVWSAVVLLGATLFHFVLWRLYLPRRQTRALLLIYLGTLALTVAVLGSGLVSALPGPQPQALPEFVQVALLVVAVTLAYIITYSAVEADSPTLVMIRAIAAAGAAGLPAEVFQNQMTDDVLVQPRLDDLVRDGMLTLDDGRYRMTAKGRRFVTLLIRYRNLLGADKGG